MFDCVSVFYGCVCILSEGDIKSELLIFCDIYFHRIYFLSPKMILTFSAIAILFTVAWQRNRSSET